MMAKYNSGMIFFVYPANYNPYQLIEYLL